MATPKKGSPRGRNEPARDESGERLAETTAVPSEHYVRDRTDPCCEELVAATHEVAGKLESSTSKLVYAAENVADALENSVTNLAERLERLPALASTRRTTALRRADLENTEMAPLWMAIVSHTDSISFPQYENFINRVLCATPVANDEKQATDDLRKQLEELRRLCQLPGVDVYQLLRTATEAFLLLECGVCPPGGAGEITRNVGIRALRDRASGTRDNTSVVGTAVNRLQTEVLTYDQAESRLNEFLRDDRNNYLRTIVRNAFPDGRVNVSPFCAATQLSMPCLLELIWSYWMEEGMLTQTINAIGLRFQNVRRPGRGPDPLADMEMDPLRPLSGFLWGYLQDETNRLSLVRRAYEYNHQYGLTLFGRAVPLLRPADPRSKFLEAFHNLLRQAVLFYREDNDTTVIADAFPVMNALKEVHLILSEGMHNQFRDLPWATRAEMLLQQWLLGRTEIREFLRGRAMIAYPETWMRSVDAMKKLQGWTDVNVIHFRDLARFGERVLLSIRYGNWSETSDQEDARAWLRFWKEEIQGYIHAYHAATGVTLSDPIVDLRHGAARRHLQPSYHLRNRLLAQRRQQRLAR